LVLLIALVCGTLDGAAAVVPAPPVVLLGVLALSLLGATIAGVVIPTAFAALRGARAVEAMRRHLDELPETSHPLGL
jgi:hypothetical protein